MGLVLFMLVVVVWCSVCLGLAVMVERVWAYVGPVRLQNVLGKPVVVLRLLCVLVVVVLLCWFVSFGGVGGDG